MTGTAKTEEREFRDIYGLDVVVMPTKQPMVRKDIADIVYRTENAKFDAVVDEIIAEHDKGRPVLVGTRSIEKIGAAGRDAARARASSATSSTRSITSRKRRSSRTPGNGAR